MHPLNRIATVQVGLWNVISGLLLVTGISGQSLPVLMVSRMMDVLWGDRHMTHQGRSSKSGDTFHRPFRTCRSPKLRPNAKLAAVVLLRRPFGEGTGLGFRASIRNHRHWTEWTETRICERFRSGCKCLRGKG